MSQAKKQYVVVFRSLWWTDDEIKAFGPFTSKVKAAKAMAALYRSDWLLRRQAEAHPRDPGLLAQHQLNHQRKESEQP